MIQDIAPHKYYVDYQPSVPNDTDLVLIYGHHTILCNFEDPEIRYPSIAEITAVFPEIKEKAKFLFRIDETDYYELRSPQLPEFGIWKYENTLILRSAVPGWLGPTAKNVLMAVPALFLSVIYIYERAGKA